MRAYLVTLRKTYFHIFFKFTLIIQISNDWKKQCLFLKFSAKVKVRKLSASGRCFPQISCLSLIRNSELITFCKHPPTHINYTLVRYVEDFYHDGKGLPSSNSRWFTTICKWFRIQRWDGTTSNTADQSQTVAELVPRGFSNGAVNFPACLMLGICGVITVWVWLKRAGLDDLTPAGQTVNGVCYHWTTRNGNKLHHRDMTPSGGKRVRRYAAAKLCLRPRTKVNTAILSIILLRILAEGDRSHIPPMKLNLKQNQK